MLSSLILVCDNVAGYTDCMHSYTRMNQLDSQICVAFMHVAHVRWSLQQNQSYAVIHMCPCFTAVQSRPIQDKGIIL